MYNPFAQPAQIWQMIFRVPAHLVPAVEEAFADITLSASSFEEEGSALAADEEDWMRERTRMTPDVRMADAAEWRVEILTSEKLEDADIASRLAVLEMAFGDAVAMPAVARVEQQDWVATVQAQFPPLVVGRFYVHGTHVTEPAPVGALPLMLNAGAAFGSGEHATTTGCLLALERVMCGRKFENILDMGTGSGILAMAAARLNPAVRILAVDIDPVAVRVARANVKNNRCTRQIRALAGEGYRAREVQSAAPYDLILANILARPLVMYAPALAGVLRPGGVAILSGLLAHQERRVMAAHFMQGLRLRRRVAIGGWHTLVLGKK